MKIEETGLQNLIGKDEIVYLCAVINLTYTYNTVKEIMSYKYQSPVILTNKGFAFIYQDQWTGKQEKVYYTLDKIKKIGVFFFQMKHGKREIVFNSNYINYDYKKEIIQSKRDVLEYIQQHINDKNIYTKKKEKRILKSIRKMEKENEFSKRKEDKLMVRMEKWTNKHL